jgi:COP9 signalosome complex subunit 7
MPSTSELTEGAALQTYVQMAEKAKGKQAAAVILQAIGAQNVFVFGELLMVPSIQQLEATEDKKHVDLLKIFAYGTYSDYKNAGNLPILTPSQIRKLKQLTIVSLAAVSKVISYAQLHQQLDIQDVRELEDLIIDAIYQGVIQGKLDQRKKQLEIECTMGRDLKPESLDVMITTLSNWYQVSEQLVGNIKDRMNHANIVLSEERKHKEELEKRIESEKKKLKEMEAEVGEAADFMHIEDMESHRRRPPKFGGGGKGRRGMN